jgi:glutathione S-transferase
MATLYGAGLSPFVRKVRVLLAEKGVAYEHDPVVPFNVSAEYKAISPLGKIPAYRDEHGALADSSVICAYLERRHPTPALYPSDPYQYARALWFEEYGDSPFIAVSGAKIFFPKVIGPAFFNQPTDEAAVAKAIAEDLPPLFDYLESQLSGDWLAGSQFSIADIAIGTQFVNLRLAGVSVDAARWPKLARYVARVHERPSFRKLIDEDRAALGQSA